MKKILLAVMVLFLAMPMVKALAGCLATPAQCQDAWDAKKEAIQARDKGLYELAAQKFEDAAKLHPQEAYKASYLLNAEGCLVGTWNPSKGYRWQKIQGTANKVKAQALLAEVRTLLDQVAADKCVFKKGVVEGYETWYQNALDATNGIFH